MRFATPIALLLLIVVPYFVWLGWPRFAYRRSRDVTSLVLRLLIVALLVLGLAGLQTVQAADKLAVVFLIDASDSIDRATRAKADEFVRDTMSHMTANDKAGIVVFGKNALVDRPVTSVKDPGGISSAPIRLDTNLAQAIRLGLAMFPSDTARRLVILSDGQETIGNALEAARLAAATGVQIDVVPLQRQAGPEIVVNDVRLPTTVNEGELFDLGVTVESQTATSANLTILSSGVVVQSQPVNLKAGLNNFVLSMKAPKQGFADFQVRVDPIAPGQSDTFFQNNELAGFTEVTGPPRILMITSQRDEIAALLPVLQQTGIQADVVGPTDGQIGLAALAGYKAVVMANVSATDLTEQRMRVLQSYVRDLGGGLVVIGGPNSYGVGGYFQTPLEEVLPVEMQIKDQKRIPRLTMVYVIDRSGSMEIMGSSGVTNLELAKEAARRSINFLFERDRAGVLSFDSNPQWLVPIQFVQNRSIMVNQIGALRPGGGTDIAAAVNEIAKTLPADPSTLKHVILLTDGGADPTGIVETVRQMNTQNGITVTSIGVGVGVPQFMQDIAVAGKGAYYNLTDLGNIPQIFAAETVLATRSYIVEQEFVPALTATSQIMAGIDAMPPLLGYVATSAKPTATVILTAPGYDDPLLASWQYGLGRAVAWTSDATSRWSRNWIGWTGFQRFWSQVIRSTILEGLNSNLDVRVEQRNGHSILVVEGRDDRGAFINSLNLEARIVDPRLHADQIKLQQVAPGRYEAEFEPTREGAYFIRVAGTTAAVGGTGAGLGAAQTTGWVLSYSPEYRLRGINQTLLDEIADLTSGRNVTQSPELVFRHDIREERASTSLWPWLLLVAVLMLPMDIAVRRVIVTRSDLRKLRAWAEHKLGLDARRAARSQAVVKRMTQLMSAKERAATARTTQTGAPETTPPAAPTGGEFGPVTPSLEMHAIKLPPTERAATAEAPRPQPQPEVREPVAPAAQPARPPEPVPFDDFGSTSPGSLASRLKERRKRKE